MDFAVRLGNSAAGDLLAKHSASYTVREAVAFNRLATNWGFAHLGGIVGNEGCARVKS